MVKSTAGEHYSISDKEEKVDGYNHSFTRCGCVHISHTHLLANEVGIAHFFGFISLQGHVWFIPIMLICYVIISVLVKNLKIKTINILCKCTANFNLYFPV